MKIYSASRNLSKYSLIFLLCVFFLQISPSSAEDKKSGLCGLWVVDKSQNNAIVKLSEDGKKELIKIDGLNNSQNIDIDQKDGSVWVTDTLNSKLIRYSEDGKVKIMEIKNSFCTPYRSALDLKENAVWVGSWTMGELIKFDFEGKQLLRIQGMGSIYEVQVSPYDGSIWVGDQKERKFIRFSSSGQKLGVTQRRFGIPMRIAINAKDGSAWTTFQHPGKVVKFSPEGKILRIIEDFTRPEGITIDPKNGSVWVADVIPGELVHLSSNGDQLKKIQGFEKCQRLSKINEIEKTFWMSNKNLSEMVKISTRGEILETINLGEGSSFVKVQ